jgi:cysteine desulfurase
MIYLDYNASAPLDPVAYEAMLPFLRERFGNPSSSHAPGKRLREAIERARGQVASLIGAQANEIIFTSGGTESINHVIRSVAFALKERGKHIITSAIEHPAVGNPCKFLEGMGYEVTYIGVDSTGRVDPQEIAGEVRPTTILISIMHSNNEVGTLQEIGEIASIAREGGVLMHTDAAQSVGKVPINVRELGVDFLSIAGHKLYGPQGIGGLYIRNGVQLEPFMHGAGHQGGRRAGTEPTALIVGLGAAAHAAKEHVGDQSVRVLCDRLWDGLQAALGHDVVMIGHPTLRLPNTLCVGFRGRISADILGKCPDICASMGAACHGAKAERSATMAAMDVPEEIAFGAVRFSLGKFTTQGEIDEAVRQLARAVRS